MKSKYTKDNSDIRDQVSVLSPDMERPLSIPNFQLFSVLFTFFITALQGAGCFDDESV